MKKILYTTALVFLILFPPVLHAATDTDSIPETEERKGGWASLKDYTKGILGSASVGIEYRVKAGLAIGGTTPIPIPLEIQKIESFNPLLNVNLEGEVIKMFDETWGMSFGLRLDSKGMKTIAKVKNYKMKMVSEDDGEIAGRWTGMVETKVDNSYLTLPVLAVWKPSPRTAVKLGSYVSFLGNGHFSGTAYDGYLRENTPVGQKIEVSRATYDFSDDLRNWAWGLQLGGEWRTFPHLVVGVDLIWGMNSIFKKGFETIAFDMYPIYGALSFGYAF